MPESTGAYEPPAGSRPVTAPAAAPKSGLIRGRYDAGNLERVKYGARAHRDEGMAQAVFLQIHGDAGV
jgi:hypothetical protein